MNRSSSSKGLKVISIITIVLAVVYILFGGLMLAGVGGIGLAGAPADTTQEEFAVALFFGATMASVFVFSGVVDIIVGIWGLQAAKGKAVRGFRIFAIIGLVLCALSLVSCFTQGSIDALSIVSNVVSLVLVGLAFYFANNIVKEQG